MQILSIHIALPLKYGNFESYRILLSVTQSRILKRQVRGEEDLMF
jgi:hypothetical protein